MMSSLKSLKFWQGKRLHKAQPSITPIQNQSRVKLRQHDLDEFVSKVDSLGGIASPNAQQFVARCEYINSTEVDQSLEPFSGEYVSQQIAVYSEVSGREINPHENELTKFDVELHSNAANPYNHGNPAALAVHFSRLSEAFRCGAQHPGAKLLDMGCGWGLSSEFAAYLGYKVTAVDICPSFIELVRRRAQKNGFPIEVVESGFDDFTPECIYDNILFYECLHHAIRPWTLLSNLSHSLAPGGSVLVAGEPINNLWWQNWGIRLDAVSVYCIRKFGWFESGWSLPFIRRCIDWCGLESQVSSSPDPEVGITLCGKKASSLSFDWVERNLTTAGFDKENAYYVSNGKCRIGVANAFSGGELVLQVQNFRPSSVKYALSVNGSKKVDGIIPPGSFEIKANCPTPTSDISIESEVWNIQEELNNGDRRNISFHVSGINWIPFKS